MNIIDKFDYPEMDAMTIDGKRRYLTPTGHLASVTTILSATKDMTGLDAWRKRIGDEEADKQIRDAINVGNLLHENLERYVLGMEAKKGNNLIHILARQMAENVINRGLVYVDEVWGVETPLYFPHAYAGRTDLIGVYKGKPAIIDFKNSKKIKKREWIEDYFLQGSAYATAHNEVYGTNINQVVILMASRDLSFETFVIEGDEFHKYTDMWIERLGQFLEA